jgi:hypothetical protein
VASCSAVSSTAWMSRGSMPKSSSRLKAVAAMAPMPASEENVNGA